MKRIVADWTVYHVLEGMSYTCEQYLCLMMM